MKLKKFWSVGGGHPGAPPLDPPLLWPHAINHHEGIDACAYFVLSFSILHE